MAEKKPTYYITTPIYYPSGKLHIGNSYTTIAVDAEARYRRLMGNDVFFLTGTDEHGQKIEEKAESLGLEPKTYVDQMATQIKDLWKLLEVSNDKFIRTTDKDHEAAVQAIFEQLLAQGDIYKGRYEGWYSVDDEEFFTESQLAEVFHDEQGNVTGGKAPSGHEVVWTDEESYFFKMSKYADWLLNYYKTHPDFLIPNARMNEMIKNFLEPGLEDLSVSRTSYKWGVPVKSDPRHVIYVWIDALSNYITALGYDGKDTTNFEKFWPANVQVVGKEIVRFHAIYWPIMLHALGLPLPEHIVGHGWLLMKNGKMSKSKGNVIYPETLVERYGLDALRYYLLKAMPFGNDGLFTPEDFVDKINYDLANDLGNLLNRTVAMVNKYFKGTVPTFESGVNGPDMDLEQTAADTISRYHELMASLHYADALSAIWRLVARTNKYIDETEPWVLAKGEKAGDDRRLAAAMSHLVASLRVIALLLQPIMTHAPKAILGQLGLSTEPEDMQIQQLSMADLPKEAQVVAKGTPIFPRLDAKAEIDFIQAQMTQTDKQKGRAAMAAAADSQWEPENVTLDLTKPTIKFEDFDQVEIKVAQIVEVKPVEGADKLLQFRLDAGDQQNRQILSGIHEWYPDYEKLTGKKVLAVTNLKPRKMRGQISQGMLLSTEHEGQVTLVIVPDELNNGDVLG